ncbi:MAG: hypothetical protein HY701_05155 [Gemmatimonadetes bacterium]|nr:hypothetical protein [Gemmatimonadota bacterium]
MSRKGVVLESGQWREFPLPAEVVAWSQVSYGQGLLVGTATLDGVWYHSAAHAEAVVEVLPWYGSWRQVADEPTSYREMTVTAMTVAAMALLAALEMEELARAR